MDHDEILAHVVGHDRLGPVDVDGEDHTLTWAQLAAGSEAVAAELQALGVAPGDPVAYQLPNRLDFLTITLGALRIGAACMPLMPIAKMTASA